MAYVKIIYQNSPSTATPINAENLNHMDDGIAENDRRLNELATAGVVNTFNGRTGNVTSEKGDYDIAQIAPTNGATEGQIPILTNVGTEEEPVLEFQMQDVPSSGHVIQNASGTDMAQEDEMQFADSFVSDDSINGRTIVENIKEVSPADYDSTTDEGIIVCDDGNDALIGSVSDDYVEVTASGDTWRSLLAKLRSARGFDFDKITRDSLLLVDNTVYRVVGLTSTVADFSFDASHLYSMIATMNLYKTGDSYRFDWTNTGGSAETSTSSVTDGTKLTLYYGNKKATVDLQTTSNRCLRPNGETVEQALTKEASTTFVPVNSSSPVTIPDIRNYRYITVGYVISNQSRFFSLATLPTSVFVNVNKAINILYSENESEITFNNYTSVNVRINQTLGWPIMIILS